MKGVRLKKEVGVCPDGGVEYEGALRLADVVASHGIFAEFGHQLRAVVDLQRLTLSLERRIKVKILSINAYPRR